MRRRRRLVPSSRRVHSCLKSRLPPGLNPKSGDFGGSPVLFVKFASTKKIYPLFALPSCVGDDCA